MNSNTIPIFRSFSKFVLENERMITPRVLSEHFINFQKSLERSAEVDEFCREADDLASKLFQDEKMDLAGIIYSGLCKMGGRDMQVFAQKGYEVAEANGDYIHMMARLNDLRRVYYRDPSKVNEYVRVLYKQEKCLKHLTRNYDEDVKNFHSVIRRPGSFVEYETMLAHVRTDIGKLTWRKHPNDARHKLLLAKATFDKIGYTDSSKYIENLLKKIPET